MAAPVFFPTGEYTVRVGVETLPRRIKGLPAMRLSLALVVSASGAGFGSAPGAVPSQRRIVGRVGAGGQGGCWAKRLALTQVMASSRSSDWRTIRPLMGFAAMMITEL